MRTGKIIVYPVESKLFRFPCYPPSPRWVGAVSGNTIGNFVYLHSARLRTLPVDSFLTFYEQDGNTNSGLLIRIVGLIVRKVEMNINIYKAGNLAQFCID